MRKIKYIPRESWGISGNDIFLNLQAYYKKSLNIFFLSYYTIFKNSLWNLKFPDMFWLSPLCMNKEKWKKSQEVKLLLQFILKKYLIFPFLRSSRNLASTSRSQGVIKSIHWGVKKGPGPRGTRNGELLVPSLLCLILFYFKVQIYLWSF